AAEGFTSGLGMATAPGAPAAPPRAAGTAGVQRPAAAASSSPRPAPRVFEPGPFIERFGGASVSKGRYVFDRNGRDLSEFSDLLEHGQVTGRGDKVIFDPHERIHAAKARAERARSNLRHAMMTPVRVAASAATMAARGASAARRVV